jgi:hypothetical protein
MITAKHGGYYSGSLFLNFTPSPEPQVSEPSVTDYLLEALAKCPRCFWQITEKTLVEPQ